MMIRKKKKTSILEITYFSFFIFSILTVLQGIPMFENINKTWLAVCSTFLGITFFSYPCKAVYIYVFITTIALHFIALYFTGSEIHHINMLFYFLLWVLFYGFCDMYNKRIRNIMIKDRKFIDIILFIWSAIVLISAFLPSSYKAQLGTHYFHSFTGSSFRLMPSALIVTALAQYKYTVTKNKKYLFYLILPTYAAFMGNSRTYFGVYLLFVVAFLYVHIKKKRNFFLLMIPIGLLVIFAALFSGIGGKFASVQYTSTSYFDFWGTITNGRTVFWLWDINAFFDLPFWQQFVGNGFNFVYEVNGSRMTEIWAHNDFINILMNFGYIGMFIYTYVFFRMYNSYINKHVPKFVRFLLLSAIFLNSMFNMSYTYLCATISYPIFMCAISEYYHRDELYPT